MLDHALPAILTAAFVTMGGFAASASGGEPASQGEPAPQAPTPAQAPDIPSAADPAGVERLDRPQPFRVQLVTDHAGGEGPGKQGGRRANGVGELAGQVAAWDTEGFDAIVERTPRRVRWDEVAVTDLLRLRKRLIERLPAERRQAATEELAAYLLSRADQNGLGTRLLEELRSSARTPAGGTPASGEAAGETVEERVRARAETLRAAREAALVRAAAARLRIGTPEAAVFPTLGWPPQTPDELGAAVEALRIDTRERLAKVGRDATPVESTHCLVFSISSVEDAAKRATELDAFITASLVRLGRPREEIPWHGRLVVIVSDDRDRFTLLEAAAFGSEARRDEIAIAHYDGPSAFVHLLEQTDAAGARPFVLRAVALALLHRHQSAVRLPAWANEGLADWLVAQHLVVGNPRSRSAPPFEAALRREGLAAVRTRGTFARTIGFQYTPGSWPFVTAADRGECYVLTSFLMERSPAAFLRFIGIVKSGEPWPAAIEQAYGRPIGSLLADAWDFHRVND